jgi:hypothetical protein
VAVDARLKERDGSRLARKQRIVDEEGALPTTDLTSLRLLYATSARIGGSGLDSVAHETLRAVQAAGIDWWALAFDWRARDLEPERIRTLRFHPRAC